MKLNQIRAIASAHNINPAKIVKNKLIKMIQIAEGNFDCFASASKGECDQKDCLWRKDCFEAAQSGELS